MHSRFVLFALLCAIGYSVAQEDVPLPSEYSSAILRSVTIVGDFDGDGNKDLLVQFRRVAGEQRNFWGVFSYAKQTYLMVSDEYFDGISGWADLDGDGTEEIVHSYKVYKFGDLTKKKIP